MKFSALVIVVLFCIDANASHIVGGQFQMTRIGDQEYKVDLIVYFDLINGNPASRDLIAMARVFRHSDGATMTDLLLRLIDEQPVNHLQPECETGLSSISRIRYSGYLPLTSAYDDPDGYYIVWERCCRNYGLTNIQSSDPSLGGIYAGQTFFIHFPPVTKGGEIIRNTSPLFKAPLPDVACIARSYTMDFGAIDPDGDSLVYSLVSPWSTHTNDPLPENRPKPFPEVQWRAPFDQSNIMGGNPRLQVDMNGVLAVTPTVVGLFGLAVKCEEFRNGVKIGEVRREFQILVTDCWSSISPVIEARTLFGEYTTTDLDVGFNSSSPDEERCIMIRVSDDDIYMSMAAEDLLLSAQPVGFQADISGILPESHEARLTPAVPAAEFMICFDKCPPSVLPIGVNQYSIDIIIRDEACRYPLTDTIRVNITLTNPDGCNHQTIDFPYITDKSLDESPLTLSAKASSDLPVQYSSSVSTISITESNMVFLTPGQATVRAFQPGNSDFKSAVPVDRTFCIRPPTPELEIIWNGNQEPQFAPLFGETAIWYVDGEPVDISPVFWHYGKGIVTAKVIMNDCASLMSNPVLITAVEANSSGAAIIYPNPTSSEITIPLGAFGHIKKVELLDPTGRLILSETTNQEIHTLSMGSLQDGIYLVKISAMGKTRINRVVKH